MCRLMLIYHTVRYCIKNKMPVRQTAKQFQRYREEQRTGVSFLITTNYINNKESFYLNQEYINQCIRLNGMKAIELMEDKTNLLRRCSDLLKRDWFYILEHSEEEKLDFIRSHNVFVGKKQYSCLGDGFAMYRTDRQSVIEIMNLKHTMQN